MTGILMRSPPSEKRSVFLGIRNQRSFIGNLQEEDDHVDVKILHGRCFIWKKDYESISQKALAISAPVSDR